MNRSLRTFALVIAALGLAACGGQKAPAEASTESGEMKGKLGVSYVVSVSRPVGGTIRSSDGRINCGSLSGPDQLCAPVSFAWTARAELTAIPDPGQYFQSWAADCNDPTPSCTLETTINAADKWVVAVFNPPERLGHGNITSPSLHAPKYFAFLGNDAGAPRCTNCHGQGYAGQGIAPSCNACHAAAGWANWQQSCSFCHGLRNSITMTGYAFADGTVNQEWAAPPDDVNGRLTGVNGAAAGAHQAHVAANDVRSPIACSECHVVPATAIHTLNHSLDLPFGPLSRSQGAVPTWDAATLTCGANYCHGNFTYVASSGARIQGKAASLAWGGSLTGCTTCHEMPPAGHQAVGSAPAACSPCHSATVDGDGNIKVAGGAHINGQADVSACDGCHWFPNSATYPATGAHLTHFGLTATDGGGSGYGDLEILELKFPDATTGSAPAKYAFGCGNCHPMDIGQHSIRSGSTVAKVLLYEAAAPAGTLKARNAATAAYDASAKTCSGVYCHSSGQESPTFVSTPAWNSGTKLGCGSCHANPPKYPSGGSGAATANSHVQLDTDNWPWGHWGLPMTNYTSQHGQEWVTWTDWYTGESHTAYYNSAPVTCQTCHFETTDPTNTRPGGFYYLDTTGDYALPNRYNYNYSCTPCHTASSSTAPLGTGKVLPLRHVNGTRNVDFDARTGNPNAAWTPDPANDPSRPYWITDGSRSIGYWTNTNADFRGTTVQFDLGPARYNPVDKSCTNVTCHMSQGNTSYTGDTIETRFYKLQWGSTYYYMQTDPATGIGTCSACHRM